MRKAKDILHVWKTVFGKAKYILLLLIVAFLFYLLNGFIVNIINIKSFYNSLGLISTIKILFITSINFANQVTPLAAIGTIILSIFLGALVSLLVFRFNTIKEANVSNVGFFGGVGMFLGMAAPRVCSLRSGHIKFTRSIFCPINSPFQWS